MTSLQKPGSRTSTTTFLPLACALIASGLVATLPAIAADSKAAEVGVSASSAQQYFWPAHHQAINYKVRSHALRGALSFARVGEVRIGADTWQQVSVTAPRIPSLNETIYQRADAQGLYTRYSTAPDAKVVRDLVLPAKVGDSWATVNRDGSPTRRKIESIGECKLRDTQFEHCVKVSFSSAEGEAVAFFAPGFGEIVNSQRNGFLERTLLAK